jgi:hypothetical protein
MMSFGLPELVLFEGGSLLALLRMRQPAARLVLVWSGGVWLFFLYFNVLHQWHPFSFRYYVLVAPWLAIVAAWGIEQIRRPWRTVTWVLVGLCTLDVGWRITIQTHQGGWQSVMHPERTLGYHIAHGWREWSQQLDHPDQGFLLGLPDDRPLAAFYRQVPGRIIRYSTPASHARAMTAEDFVPKTGGWAIVPASLFMGREGQVAASSWLFQGDENNPYSVVAYRRLAPGEKPRAFFYRRHWNSRDNRLWQELLIKTFSDASVRLTAENPTAIDRAFTWATPLAQGGGTIPANGQVELVMPAPVNAVIEVRLGFDDGAAFAQSKPVISLRD